MKQILFTPSALRQRDKLSADVRTRIDAKLADYAKSGAGEVTQLKGMDGCRLRIGDWRALFFNEQTRIVVYALGHRREIYN